MPEPFDPYYRWLGIPPEDQPPNHYRLLGIALFEDQPDVIERAADRQMAHLRTFQVGPHSRLSQKLLNEVASAKLCLLKGEKKAAYDEFLRNRLAGAKRHAAPADDASTPPPFPVAPPGEGSPLVELDVPDEKSSVSSPVAAAWRRRRWIAAGAGVAAAGLMLTIVMLAGRLTFSPSLPSVPPHVNQDHAVASAQRQAQKSPPRHSSAPTSVAAGPANDEAFDDDVAFWEEWLEAGAESPPLASAPAKPKQPPLVAKPVPKAEPQKSAKAVVPPVQPSTATAALPGPPAVAMPPSVPRASPKKPEWKPEPFKRVAALDPVLAEAWTLIRRGEYVKGRDRLVQAAKMSREDIRVPFSLGLIDALLTPDWNAAEREFLQCVQEHPKHVASLNNLALVRLRLNRESQSVRHWQTALAEGPPPAEIVQNLGRVQYLLQKERLSFKPTAQKAINKLFTDALLAGNARFDRHVGFRYMGLYGGGDPDFGFSRPQDYEDRWCVVCNATGRMQCPARDCNHGFVTRMSSKVIGINPLTKMPIYYQPPLPTRVPCPTCRGAGWIPCPYCRDGKDKELVPQVKVLIIFRPPIPNGNNKPPEKQPEPDKAKGKPPM